MLFDQLPKTTFMNKTIVDITKGVRINREINANYLYDLQDYTVEEGERPDHIANYYYDDPAFSWLVLLPNTMLDPYYHWPMTTRQFDAWMAKKYGDVQTAQSTILHYEHTSKDITISTDTYNLNTSLDYIIGGDYQAVYAYDHYSTINDNNRHIKLVHKKYINNIINDLGVIFNE